MQKEKQEHPQTKEELVAELTRRANVTHRITVIREKIHPILLETKNLAHLEQVIQVAKTLVERMFMKKQTEVKICELGQFTDYINKDGDDAGTYENLQNVLNEETVESALEILGGIPFAVRDILELEKRNRKYSDIDILSRLTPQNGDQKTDEPVDISQ